MALLNLTALVRLVGGEVNVYKKGEVSYKENHVESCSYDPATSYVTGSVFASLKKIKYKCSFFISSDRDSVFDQKCSCPRGELFCHHMVALGLHVIHNVSSTDVSCKWTRPSSTAKTARKVEELFPTKSNFTALAPEDLVPLEDMKKDLRDHHSLSGAAWILSDEPANAKDIVPPFSVEALLFSPGFLEATDKKSFFFGQLDMSCRHSEILQIEKDTRGQYLNPLWQIGRKFRLTSSNFGLVIKQIERNSYPPSMFKTLLGSYDTSGVRAIQWGLHHEKDAVEEYERLTGRQVTRAGLVIHTSGVLATSPDGFVGEDRILEVKCPYRFRDESMDSVISDGGFFLESIENKCFFKMKNDLGFKYYHQIQGAMHITGKKYCDFVVWTTKGLLVVEFEREEAWTQNFSKLLTFYTNYFFSKITHES